MALARAFSRAIPVATVAAVGLMLAHPAPARAESVRDAVARHLETELPKKEESSGWNETSPPCCDTGLANLDDDAAADPDDADQPETIERQPPPAVPPAPRRPTLFGRPAYLDVSLQSRMQVWLPAQNPSVHLDAAPYRTYRLELSGGIEGLFTLHRLAFETDGSTWVGWSGPAVSPVAATNAMGTAAALAMIGLPFLHGHGSHVWEPIIRYELSSYATTATPSGSVCLVGRNADSSADPPDCTRTDGPLRMASRFESLVAGVQVGGDGGSSSFYAGLDFVRQRKPYQVNVDGRTLDDYLFDARFGGAGMAVGFGVGGDRGFSMGGGVHLGWAWVSLTDDLSLSDELPPDWSLEYFRWDVRVGYGLVLLKGSPQLLVRATVDGSGSHFLYQTDASEETPSLSRDLFFAGSLSLTLVL
jgi:hypothetical protein